MSYMLTAKKITVSRFEAKIMPKYRAPFQTFEASFDRKPRESRLTISHHNAHEFQSGTAPKTAVKIYASKQSRPEDAAICARISG